MEINYNKIDYRNNCANLKNFPRYPNAIAGRYSSPVNL